MAARGMLGPSFDDENNYPMMIEKPQPGISVSDVARLAQAGVTVNLKEIADYVRPDVQEQPLFDASMLLKPLVDRLIRFKGMQNHMPFPPNRINDFFFSAWCGRGKVFVFVCPQAVDCTPCILEDEIELYPSDALMAKIHLLNESHSKIVHVGEGVAVENSASQQSPAQTMRQVAAHINQGRVIR